MRFAGRMGLGRWGWGEEDQDMGLSLFQALLWALGALQPTVLQENSSRKDPGRKRVLGCFRKCEKSTWGHCPWMLDGWPKVTLDSRVFGKD